MCEFYDKLRHDFEVEFKAIGIEEGIEQGKRERSSELAKLALQDGSWSVDQIAKLFQLSREEVLQLAPQTDSQI